RIGTRSRWPGLRELLSQTCLLLLIEHELCVEPLQSREVRGFLLRERSEIALFEVPDLAFLIVELLLHLVELILQKIGGTSRLPPAHPQILIDVAQCQIVRNRCDLLRVPSLVADGEGDNSALRDLRRVSSQLETNVLPHLLDDVVERETIPELGVEAESVDQ